MKIVQIQTAPATTNAQKQPFLFGLDEEGKVYFWDFSAKEWKPIESLTT